MTRSGIDHAGLPGQMGGALGNLAADVAVSPQVDGILQEILRPPTAPGNTTDGTRQVAHQQRFAVQALCQSFSHGHRIQRALFCQIMPADDALAADDLAPPALHGPAQQLAQLDVVAVDRMHIQRQVIGQQVDVGPQQTGQTAAADANDTRILALPEVAMMHQQRVGPFGHGRVDHVLGCSNGADDAGNHGLAFHLQPVWGIILDDGRTQQIIQMTQQFPRGNCPRHMRHSFLSHEPHGLDIGLCMPLQHSRTGQTPC